MTETRNIDIANTLATRIAMHNQTIAHMQSEGNDVEHVEAMKVECERIAVSLGVANMVYRVLAQMGKQGAPLTSIEEDKEPELFEDVGFVPHESRVEKNEQEEAPKRPFGWRGTLKLTRSKL